MFYLVFLPTSFSNAQVSTTGDLTNFTNQATGTTSTWQNAGSIGQPLTCWAYGDPGYCGPNPRVAAWGTGSNIINYSYGLVDLHQLVNIKNALPNTGTGLQVNGFNFGFTAKNGNGWDDGRQDYLMAYVKFYDAANSKVLENYTYNQNSRYNWTTFRYSETFATPYASSSLGNAQFGFVGKDNNGWMGPYGPEIQNTYFNLKYSVDPCATNVLSSPSCPGYLDALAKITVAPVNAVSTPTAPTGDPLPLPGSPTTTGPVVQVSQPVSQPVNNPATTQERNSGGPANLSFALNLVSRNANRERALAQQVVTSSIAEAQSASDKTQQQAIAIATTSAAMSTVNVTTSSVSNVIGSTSSSVVAANAPQMQAANVAKTTATASQQTFSSTIEQPKVTSSAPVLQQNTGLQIVAPVTEVAANTATNFSFSAQTYSLQETEAPQSATSFLLDRTSPLREIIEFQQFQQPQPEQKTAAVNRSVAANELATGTSLEKMAVQPVNYASYTNFALKDANFYAPKDIYPKQTTVDNARALRQLSSDRLHQQMVQDQYR